MFCCSECARHFDNNGVGEPVHTEACTARDSMMRESEPYTKHLESSPEGLQARHELALATFNRLQVNPIYEGEEFPTFLGEGRARDELEATTIQERDETNARMAKQKALIAEKRNDPSNVALAAEFLESATDAQSMAEDEHKDDMSETTIVDQSQKIEIAIKRAKTALVKDGSLPDGEPPVRGSDEENRGLAALQIMDDDTGRERSCGKTEGLCLRPQWCNSCRQDVFTELVRSASEAVEQPYDPGSRSDISGSRCTSIWEVPLSELSSVIEATESVVGKAFGGYLRFISENASQHDTINDRLDNADDFPETEFIGRLCDEPEDEEVFD